ncbi:hypothetical protein TNCV_1407521 [Trichonephila clavipes]|nr:hypothetical protein TNCV_1407521 [Trichonephila clavipes]
MNDAIIEIKMAPHKPRKSTPELDSEDEDMIEYNPDDYVQKYYNIGEYKSVITPACYKNAKNSQIPPKKSRRKPTSDLNKALTGGALRTSPKKKSSPGHLSRCFLTADSQWLGTRACAVPAISLRRCQSMFWVFHCNKFLTLKPGEWGATSVVLLVTQLEFRMTRSVCA